MDILANISFLIVAISFWLRDIIVLRSTLALACICAVGYQIGFANEANYTVIFWNSIFVLINVSRIYTLLKEKYSIQFTQREYDLWQNVFSDFSDVEFMRLMRTSTWQKIKEGSVITQDGEPCPSVFLIAEGEIQVSKQSRQIATLKTGQFVGEMSFAGDGLATADTLAVKDCMLVAWDQADLKRLIELHPGLVSKVHALLGKDMVEKLRQAA